MEQQLIDLKEKMQSTHWALMTYQRDLGTADPEQKTNVLVARLQALNTENSAAEADRIAKEAVYREAKDGSLPEVEVSGQSTDLAKDVEKLQVAKANLALVGATYGDQHPEYRKALAQLDGSPCGAGREPPECRRPHPGRLPPNADSRAYAIERGGRN